MKRLLGLILVVCLMLGMVGCAGEKETEVSSETNNNETITNEGGKEAVEELVVWCWDPSFNIYAMEEAAKVYKKENPNFKLTVVETPWNDLQMKLTTAVTSGQYNTLPDIILMQDNAFQKNYINYPDAFVDLTDTAIDFEKFASAKVAYSVVEGRNFGVPFDNGTTIMALRADVLDKAGLSVSDFENITWDEFIALGEIVLEKTGQPLMSTTAGSPDMIMQMLQSCGSSLFNEDGSLNIVGNKALVEAMDVYVELVEKGVMVEVNEWDQYIGTISNGTVAGTMNGCWILGSIQATGDQSGKWGLTNSPSLNDIPNATNYTNNGGSSWFITSNSKNPDLAIDFMAKTFAGSVEFYETILPTSGALATYLPAGDSEVYGQPSEFFGGQKIFSDIVEYAGHVPSNITGVYFYEARDAIGVALTNIVAGANLEDEIKSAEETVKFQMGQ